MDALVQACVRSILTEKQCRFCPGCRGSTLYGETVVLQPACLSV